MATICSNNETININPTDDLVLYKEEFINSRIEKFLYAICALDFDDLPTPLSRIEELYKCLATGLPAPTFTPQSRVEKYLMAILGGYSAGDLPAPQSRTEVLLNKILMGDTDLSDIEWLKSRYEFLLAYIAKGGEISSGSGDDFEYLQYIFSSSMYSIDRTKELPVKSAFLKGNTLVNISSLKGEITIAPNSVQYIDSSFIKTSTIYTVSFNCSSVPSTGSIEVRQVNGNTALKMDNITVTQGYNQFIVLTHSSEITRFRFKNDSASTMDFIFNDLMILEGDYRGVDIPYFEGINSVKIPVLTTTGKNLFDGKWAIGSIGNTNGLNSGGTVNINSVNHISVKPNTAYVASSSQLQHENIVVWYAYDINKKLISYSASSRFFTTPSNCEFIRVRSFDKDSVNMSLDCVLQIEEGSVATEYEPYKSTTVACNEEVELRRIGDVKDELDLVTGELTRRIDESGNILSQEITESIDISIVDQDGNDTKLSSFEDITHVTVTSNGILPDVELSVAKYRPYLTFLLESVSNDTLYNTKELPVKSAILKGQTLVNMVPQDKQHADGISNVNLTEGRLTWSTQSDWLKLYFVVNGKPNSKYIIKYQSINENVGIFCRPETTDPHSGWHENVTALNQIIYTYDVGTFVISLENAIASSDLWVQDFMIIEYQEGMENWDIPYFEGMKSVEMPVLTTNGKNLIDLYIESGNCPGEIVDRNTVVIQGNNSYSRYNIPVFLETNKTYTFTGECNAGNIRIRTNSDGSGEVICSSGQTFTMNKESGIYYLSLNTIDYVGEVTFSNIQLEEGSVATEYEPYKSTTLTCNEEVELRGIGDVKDELDLLNGEVTHRIGEIVLNGDESWTYSGYSTPDYPAFYIKIKDSENVLSYTNFICDMFASGNVKDNTAMEGAQMNKNDSDSSGANFLVRISGSKLSDKSTDGFTEYLRNNPITLCYTLKTELVSSANITTKDQDGNEAELSSFEDITHVTVTSEGILPDVELEVATKNEEVLNTMSLRMDDIYATQTTLEETSNAQSENVDATMMATTEIYEGLL